MATGKRKFYRSVVKVEILSEDPIPDPCDLDHIAFEITEGDWSGSHTTEVANEECDGPTMAKLLQAQGSDPEFFMLTPEGEDTEDYEDDDENEDEKT